MAPRLSVCIPAYNQPHFLREALSSLCDQRLSRDELVVVVADDASPQPLAPIAESFGDRLQIHYHRGEKNIGHLANFARAFELSHTPLVSFLSHDDVVAPGQLGLAVELLDRRPDAVLVASLALCQRYPGAIDTRMHGMFIRGAQARYDAPYEWHRAEWLALSLISTPLSITGAVFRSDVFRQCRRWLSFPLWHDRLMLAEMGLHGTVTSLPWIGGYYRVQENQLSAQLSRGNAAEFRAVSEVILEVATEQKLAIVDFWIEHLVSAPEHERAIYLRLLDEALPPRQFASLRRACERRLGRRLPLTRLERLRVPRSIATLVRGLDRALAGRSQ
jgi:glycosyltransferase involved in cell wall biosynthesis